MKKMILMLALSLGFAAHAHGFKEISRQDLLNQIQFQYMSSDGEFQLSCKHLPNSQFETDYDVYCGKGSPNFREYQVHLIIRGWSKPEDTTYEILYWLTDRANPSKPAFSSTSQLITLAGKTALKKLSLSQSLENDAAQLYLTFKP